MRLCVCALADRRRRPSSVGPFDESHLCLWRDCAQVNQTSHNSNKQASKAKAESVIRYISAKTFETANNLHGYVNGHKTGLNSHGTEWLSVILGEMIQTQTYPYVAE